MQRLFHVLARDIVIDGLADHGVKDAVKVIGREMTDPGQLVEPDGLIEMLINTPAPG
jgi:hypothetical protein